MYRLKMEDKMYKMQYRKPAVQGRGRNGHMQDKTNTKWDVCTMQFRSTALEDGCNMSETERNKM